MNKLSPLLLALLLLSACGTASVSESTPEPKQGLTEPTDERDLGLQNAMQELDLVE